jgi:hypothetical protein
MPNISFTTTPSEPPILRILTKLEFQILAQINSPFITLSPFALEQLKSSEIDPFTFQPLNGARRICNIFLLGKTVSLCLLARTDEQRLCRLIVEMGGVLRPDSQVDFVISPEPMSTMSKALIVRPTWIENLWASNVFLSPARYQFSRDHHVAKSCDMSERQSRILMLLQCKKSYHEIATECHVSTREISEPKKSLEMGTPPPLRKLRGRPSITSQEVVMDVRTLTVEDPHLGSGQLAKMLHEKLDVDISRQTVCSIRNQLRFRETKARNCPLICPVQEQKRVVFCHDALEGAIDWTNEVLISDESRFGLYDDSRSMWIQRGVYAQRTFHPVPKHDTSIKVWGAPMLQDNGVVTAMVAHFAGRKWFFQQDGSPAHRAKTTIHMLEGLNGLIRNWPPNSPDLSPVQHVWGILNSRTAARGPSSTAELLRMLIEEWNNSIKAFLMA